MEVPSPISSSIHTEVRMRNFMDNALNYLPSPNTTSSLPDPDEWRYEMRRLAQEIIPGLWLGPFQASRDLTDLQQKGITHILCIGEERDKGCVKVRFPEQFTYLSLDLKDTQDQNLITIFPQSKAFIDSALQSGGRILVHCKDGISRSPAIVTAYIMCMQNESYSNAFQSVQGRRFCISPNPHFQHQIEAYESIYKANLAMISNNFADQRLNSRRKRDDVDDSDMSMDDEGDVDMGAEGSLATNGFSPNRARRLRS